MTNTVIGVFDSYTQAEAAKDAFEKAGFDGTQTQLYPREDSEQGRSTALTSGAIDDASRLSGAGGTLHSVLITLFGAKPYEKDAAYYAEAVRRGSFVLVVNAQTEAHREKAVLLMEQFEPIDIEYRANQWKATGWESHDRTAPPLDEEEIARERKAFARADRNQEQTVPLIQEELQVEKRAVQRGGVRVYQRIVETPVNESVLLREEHVKVERHPVDQPATAEMLAKMKDDSFELREMGEEVVVSKTARVVEEVTIDKQTLERQETVSDTVHRSTVDVEPLRSTNDASHDPNKRA